MKSRFDLIMRVLAPEKSFYFVAVVYGVGVSLLTLAIPISVQALVNTVTFGVLLQPLIVLSVILLGLLIFSGVLNALQAYVIEMFQRHFYARVTGDIALRVLNANHRELLKIDSVDLLNKYFDVMTVQKSMTILLTGGVSIILQTLTGLFLLAFYHPYFLVFDLILILCLALVWSFYGKRAMETAVEESKKKYEVAEWLQTLGKNNFFFRGETRKNEALKISNRKIEDYLETRNIHFKKLFSQTIILLCIYALMSSIILGLGGYLVIIGQLTLGQLVASELIVTIILAGFSKGGKYLESFYDLYAAADKLSKFYDLKIVEESEPSEKLYTKETFYKLGTFDLNFDDVHCTYNNHKLEMDFSFKYGKNYCVHFTKHSLSENFVNVLKGYSKVKRGRISFGTTRIDEMSHFLINDLIYFVEKPTAIKGGIINNLVYSCPNKRMEEIDEVLELVDLNHLAEVFPNGLKETILPSGYPLYSSQFVRFEFAKALLSDAKVLIIGDILGQLDASRKDRILEYIFKSEKTLISMSEAEFGGPGFDKFIIVDDNGASVLEKSSEEITG